MKIKYIISSVAVVLIVAFYLKETPRHTIGELYQGTDRTSLASLDSFRTLPLRELVVEGQTWKYLAVGHGTKNILFLHGMAGSYDIWWQQIQALKKEFRIITLTYPPAHSLREMGDAVIKILEQENIHETSVVGSSLGGYFAQYLKTTYPNRFKRAVFGNTFPPNDLYKEKNNNTATIARYLPEWLVMYAFRSNVKKSVIPASEFSPITEAFLLEQSYGGMSRDQFLARYHCVIDRFTPDPNLKTSGDILIIESNNDPLIFPELRQRIKELYPAAKVHTFRGKGHFPYLNEPRAYNRVITEFLEKP